VLSRCAPLANLADPQHQFNEMLAGEVDSWKIAVRSARLHPLSLERPAFRSRLSDEAVRPQPRPLLHPRTRLLTTITIHHEFAFAFNCGIGGTFDRCSTIWGFQHMSYKSSSSGDLAVDDVDDAIAVPGISWGAVLAGGVIAAAIAASLNILGAGVAAMTVDAVARDTPAASSLGMGAAIWMVVANTIALVVGGYTAARLSGTTSDTDGVLHGLAVWAVAFLVSAVLLGNAVAGAASTAASTAASALGGATSAVSSAVGQAVPEVSPNALIERAQATLRGTGGPAQAMTTEQRSAEIATILGRRVTSGSFNPQDRTRINELVAAEMGVAPDEAARRVDAVEAEARRAATEAERVAREAADAAARATKIGAFSAFGALLIGAIGAILGARRGTRSRIYRRRVVANAGSL
jgi:hypothetical protein